ncbi:CsbD family protein [Stenomitos frigidus]|uniref:CsbD family protein n=1 Tax=Stenomitos frigidus ULC18 TaxID=2107698 RepID=A0A2T1E9Z4_9CYAN|nr:CsbD family protein [Stenomitos frigidus]PSB29523.1 CsbD family protein [Stenomitos frigidus ULC18]
MISLQQARKFLLTISMAFLLSTAITFGFASENSWAATPLTLRMSQPHTQIAAMNRAKAVTKNIEGKAQEMIGNITGDPKDQVMGKAKQVESQARHAAEDVKDSMRLKERAKAVTKNVEGKGQEAVGKITGSPKDQMMGKAKQVESQARHAAEDVKAKG